MSPTPYRATLFDLGAIPMTAAGCKEDPVLAVLYPLGCLVDLPFSLVADTVCLPFDLVKLASKKKP